VSVNIQKPFIERKIDRLIVNVSSSPVNAGQTALDVLEKSPGVSVDDNGNISINGKQGAQIFIDGRINYLAGPDLLNYLRGIPASQLDQVEIMTQPSAKYDAAGNAGILNLKTKKNQYNGFNGSVTINGNFGVYVKSNENLTLNWKKNKFNISANYGISWFNTFNNTYAERGFRTGYNMPFSQYINQFMPNIYKNRPNTPRVTMDYQASKNTSLGMGVSGFFTQNQQFANGTTNVYDSLKNLQRYEVSGQQTKTTVSNLDFNLNLQQKIDKKGKELTVDADYIFYHSPGYQTSDNYFYNQAGTQYAPYLLNSHLPSDIDIYSAKADYSQPLPGNTKLETGVKTSYVRTDNDAQYTVFDTLEKQWVLDAGLINHFIYTENINAGYINFTKQIKKKWTLQLGLRAEQTISKGNELVTNYVFKKNYTKLFPTAYLNYAMNDDNSFTISCGRRIDRPSYLDLNPFKYIIDRYTIRQGNPYLQPVFTNNVELEYNYKGMLDITLNYTKTDGLITTVLDNITQGGDNITTQTRENVDSRRNVGIAVDFDKQVAKWWRIDYTLLLSNNRYTSHATGLDTIYNLTTFRAFINNDFPLKNGWKLNLSAFYLGKRPEGVLIYAQSAGAFSFGGSKKILKDKGTITLNMNDPFGMFWGPVFSNETTTFKSTTTNRRDNRYLSLTFNYRFGKELKIQKRRTDGSAQDEERRVNF
jgi:hypothetical protein